MANPQILQFDPNLHLAPNFDSILNICCIGATQSSVLNMAVIAERYPRLNVVVTDFDQLLLERWGNWGIDFTEVGLAELLQNVLFKNLHFEAEVEIAIGEAQMIFIGVDIPLKEIGRPKGLDLGSWTKAIRWIAGNALAPKIIVERSTMPIGSFNMTTTLLLGHRPPNLPAVEFVVLANPDFSSTPGCRLQDLRNPDRVVIAVKSNVLPAVAEQYARPLRELYLGLVQNPNAIRTFTNVREAVNVEIAKIATNAMLGLKLTFINAISSLCDHTRDADVSLVGQLLGDDYRLDSNYMAATLGIGGPELIKDALYLKHAFSEAGLHTEAKLTNKISQLDKRRRNEFIDLMLKTMLSLKGRRIAIFGVGYKKNALDTTRSPAISICKSLLKEGARLRIYDPLINGARIRRLIGNPTRVTRFANPVATATTTHACVFLAPMDHLQFDFEAMVQNMGNQLESRYLFLGWHMHVNYEALRGMGFQVYVSGKSF